jgi:hypothetical protein
MDHKDAVGHFRDMLDQYDIVSKSETVLACLMSADVKAVEYFAETYLDHESGTVRNRMVLFSLVERRKMFERDLEDLAQFGQYLNCMLEAQGLPSAMTSLSHMGFLDYRKLSSLKRIRCLTGARSKAAMRICFLRETLYMNSGPSKAVGQL